MTVDERILGMTTIIESKSATYNYTSQGTGFFYTELSKEAPTPEKNGNEWRKVENMWLITNRHVAFPRITQADGTVVESIPDTFIYNMRREKDGKIEWVPIVLNKDEFLFLK